MSESKLEYWSRKLIEGMTGGGYDLDKHECAELVDLLDQKPEVPSESYVAEGKYPLPVYVGAMNPEQIAALADCRPGDIQVVYPLDEEWNAAIEAAAQACDGYDGDSTHCAIAIRYLKRPHIKPLNQFGAEMSISPAALEMLLHYYVTPLKYEFQGFEADDHDRFEKDGLLQKRNGSLKNEIGDEYDPYELTERGHAYIAAILNMPLPVKEVRWIVTYDKPVRFSSGDVPARQD